ncbi:MAG: hypothetical protein ACJ746_21160 [Bryobacteraceae bacterium]
MTGQGGSLTSKITITVMVQTPGTFALGTTSNYFSVGQNYTGILNVLVTASGGFNAPVSLTIPGLPVGVTASASVTPSGTATMTVPLPIVASKSAATGLYGLMVTATVGARPRRFRSN